MNFENSLAFAQQSDASDPLGHYRKQFHLPELNGKQCIYFTGNSLGLQPKKTAALLQLELDDWAKWGVEGHFRAKNPWFSYHELFAEKTARLVGALPEEVVLMNSLTTNLHLQMISFYRPGGKRYKILCEAKAFPSDQYALESQVRLHGYDPAEAIVEVQPRAGRHTIDEQDIESLLQEQGETIALVLIGGVNYYTGQVFNLEKITAWGHAAGALVGFDLAHAAGNVALRLHDWNVDFAAWCSYKYLNSGPGGVGGAFIHQRHVADPNILRLAGWWGHDKNTRFKMEKGFSPIPTAESWQLSNAPVMAMACHKASLDIFDDAGIHNLVAKSKNLTAYLEFVINNSAGGADKIFEIITPFGEGQRGCQLSVLTHGQGKDLFDKLTAEGVVADWREPNVIRMAPVPLYNSFEDVFTFGQILKRALQ